MDITKSEFEKTYILNNEHGRFFPKWTFDEYIPVYSNKLDEPNTITDYMYVNLMITETAEEDYRRWLTSKDTPIRPEDKIEVLEQQLKQQEAAIGLLATQIAKNTLLQNGGMK